MGDPAAASPDRRERPVTVAFDALGAEAGTDAVAEGVRIAAADGIAVRVFGPAAAFAGLAAGRRDRRDQRGDRQRRGAGPAVRSRPEASIVRAAADVAARRLRRARQPRFDRRDDDRGAVRAEADPAVQRPALAVADPGPGPASARCCCSTSAPTPMRAQHLVQFAYLGAAFAEAVLGVAEPRVGLLSVGEEAEEGQRRRRRGARDARRLAEGIELRRQRRGPRPPRSARSTWSSPTGSPATSR